MHHFQCINIFTSLCKNLFNLLEFLAQAFRCHEDHFQCINIFTSLCKNLFNLLEFLAQAFRCHVHHFQCINIFTSLCKNMFNLLEFLAEAFRCHVHHFQCLTVPVVHIGQTGWGREEFHSVQEEIDFDRGFSGMKLNFLGSLGFNPQYSGCPITNCSVYMIHNMYVYSL